jgi:N-dimethylarginine dimethylaminohydrolase
MLRPHGWRVETIYFDATFGYHLDVLMPVIREGLLAVGKDVLLTDLPKELQDWEVIDIDPEEYALGAGNTTPLSSQRIVITAEAKRFIREVERRDVEVVPVPFSTVYSYTGSGIHCATFAYWREDD